MKRILFIAIPLFLLISVASFSQKPEKIYSFVKVYKSHEYYNKQAELWWKEIEKDKKNEDG